MTELAQQQHETEQAFDAMTADVQDQQGDVNHQDEKDGDDNDSDESTDDRTPRWHAVTSNGKIYSAATKHHLRKQLKGDVESKISAVFRGRLMPFTRTAINF